MALVRWITEMGMGADLHGGDYTKAARRAVSDALRHSSLSFFGPAGKQASDMHVHVLLGAARPEQIDTEAVAAEVPYGTVTVEARPGGLDVPPHTGDDPLVLVNAAILVSFDER
jgi:uncharacterized protein (TIGR02058 family)